MVFQMAILLAFSVLSQVLSESIAPASQLEPLCESRCGDIEIDYPFSSGFGCIPLGIWFVIFCNKTANSSRAFLSSIHMEVIKIDYANSQIRVKSPIISSNCSDHITGQPVNLRGTPFTISADNRFTVVGCNNLALLSSSEPHSIGCQPSCDDELKPDTQCFGNRCCQTAIPCFLQVFIPIFENPQDQNSLERCRVTFIVDNEWFNANIKDPYKVKELEYVPMVLDWRINATALELLQINEETTRHGAIMYYNGYDFPYPNNTILRCRNGYAGNPYLFYGCQDVDECQDAEVLQRCHGECVNTKGSYTCENDISIWILVMISACGGLLFLIICIWRLYKFIKKRRKIKSRRKFFKQNWGLMLERQARSSDADVMMTRIFSLKELEKATDNFNVDRILGDGGQGTVYKGMLADGRIVAVKKSKKVDGAKLKEFINETFVISQINHRNVVQLLGCCLETEVPLLVYEFIPNGTLYQYLHEQKDFQFSWEMRLRMAIEVSGAVSYLHSAASKPIYHRDIKSTNILLDEKYRAKVSDFGTSRSISTDQTHLTTHVQGTFGYMDPEYFQSSKFTEKSDVYSFGVVLVELLTGQKPVSSARVEEGVGLAAHFVLSMDKGKLFDIIDPRMVEECDKEEVLIVASLAKRCVNQKGKLRPTMKEVTLQLEGIRVSQKESSTKQNNDEIKCNPFDASPTSTFSSSDGDHRLVNTHVEPLELQYRAG